METLSLLELFRMFGTNSAAEDWFIKTRWPDGIRCVSCDGERVRRQTYHKTQPFHCIDCNKFFSVKTDTVLHSSKLSYQKWAIAIHLIMTRPKGVSARQLSKDLDTTHKTAWHLAHRIRKALESDHADPFLGPVEVDEAFIGGLAKNQTYERKRRSKKEIIIGMRDQDTNRVRVGQIQGRNAAEMQGFVYRNTTMLTEVYTDEASGYRGLARPHQTVNHSVGEYGLTNGIESFWAIVKRAYKGVYHYMSPQHLHRYILEFQERHNRRPLSDLDKMETVVRGSVGKRLRLKDLIQGRKRR